MTCHATLSHAAAVETVRLIEEYLIQGGTGRDENRLIEALQAMTSAAVITIAPQEQ